MAEGGVQSYQDSSRKHNRVGREKGRVDQGPGRWVLGANKLSPRCCIERVSGAGRETCREDRDQC